MSRDYPTGAEDIAILADAMAEITESRDADACRYALETMSIAGVLFMAIAGNPGERWVVDPPLVVVLRAVRDTLDGWASAASTRTGLASVPIGDLHGLSDRMDAAIEIARRSLEEATPPSTPTPWPSKPPPSEPTPTPTPTPSETPASKPTPRSRRPRKKGRAP